MFIGLAELMQIVIFVVSAVIIFKWFKAFRRDCPYCEMEYETFAKGSSGVRTVGRATKWLDEERGPDYDMIMYLEYDNNEWLLWTWIQHDNGFEHSVCKKIKYCPVCGRKLK